MIELELKRIADRLEMIHNHLVKFPEKDKTLDAKLEANEANGEKVAKKPGRPAKVPIATKLTDVDITEEDVRKAALKLVRAHPAYEKEGSAPGKNDAKTVLKEFGVSNVEELDANDYAAVIKGFERKAGTYVADAEESDDEI